MMSDASNAEVLWTPSPRDIERANITGFCRAEGYRDYAALYEFSIRHREHFWAQVIAHLGIQFRRPFDRILDASVPTRPNWLVGAKLNIVESCFQAADDAIANIEGDGLLHRVTFGALRRSMNQIASALVRAGIHPGDAVAIVMPMHNRSVAAYLAVIACGGAVISIADSFATPEIASRLRIGEAKLVLTQESIPRGGKRLPLYDKVSAAAENIPIIVADTTAQSLRPRDRTWDDFIDQAADTFEPVPRDPHHAINILFSSGTTGDPKAIPWDHTTPIKCAMDAHFHQDVHAGDVVCWPTSLGWMMGPWLIFASLINKAAMALYAQSPLDSGLGKFVQEAHVTQLGLVPSMVRAWRESKALEGLDLRSIRAFSSSGECSNTSDMGYLMRLAGGRPILEYCGGTEIGGGYITSTVVQPNKPSTFSTPALGIELTLLDDAGQPAERGEVFLVGPSIGLSTRLLNRDHDAVYFDATPIHTDGTPLRRHGDELERLPDGYYRATGRCDDTMNLGGIKVGCAEIERVLNQIEGVSETAAVAVAPPDGGPSRLVVFTVVKPGSAADASSLKALMQQAIREKLNPLFRVDEVRIIPSLPRTASNKVIRRALRAGE